MFHSTNRIKIGGFNWTSIISIDFIRLRRCYSNSAGRSIIRKLPRETPWSDVKAELCEVLGVADPRAHAVEELLQYKAKGRGLGEIAVDIMAKAAKATDDAAMQTTLGLKAFLQAVPEEIGHDLRRKHFESVREALDEARFLQKVQDAEGGKNKVLALGSSSEKPPVAGVDISQVVEQCLKQMKSQAGSSKGKGKKSGPPGGRPRRRPVCWCCGEEGHLMFACPTVVANRAAYEAASRPEQSENESGAR